jgi:hypothetical protein
MGKFLLKPFCFAQDLIIPVSGTYCVFREPQKTLRGIFDLQTYLTKTRLYAGILVHTASWTAVTADAAWVTPIAKLAAVTFFSCITFLTWTLARPLPWGENKGKDPT